MDRLRSQIEAQNLSNFNNEARMSVSKAPSDHTSHRGSAKVTIFLCILGMILALVFLVKIWPKLNSTTVTRTVNVTRPVSQTKMTKHTVKVDGKEVQVDVPETVYRDVAEVAVHKVTIEPTMHERIWLYCFTGVAGVVLLFSLGTMALWFYFLVRKDGEVPPVVTEMLKYLLASFMGIFVGFMGGSSVSAARQANIEMQTAPPPAIHNPV
jgi:hypothetical protein